MLNFAFVLCQSKCRVLKDYIFFASVSFVGLSFPPLVNVISLSGLFLIKRASEFSGPSPFCFNMTTFYSPSLNPTSIDRYIFILSWWSTFGERERGRQAKLEFFVFLVFFFIFYFCTMSVCIEIFVISSLYIRSLSVLDFLDDTVKICSRLLDLFCTNFFILIREYIIGYEAQYQRRNHNLFGVLR